MQARKLAHDLWPTEGVEGQLSQELALPSHFEAAAANVTEEMVAEQVSCGPDPEVHVEAIHKYLDAGFDEVYINQIGPNQDGFFRFYERELRSRLGVSARCAPGLVHRAAIHLAHPYLGSACHRIRDRAPTGRTGLRSRRVPSAGLSTRSRPERLNECKVGHPVHGGPDEPACGARSKCGRPSEGL